MSYLINLLFSENFPLLFTQFEITISLYSSIGLDRVESPSPLSKELHWEVVTHEKVYTVLLHTDPRDQAAEITNAVWQTSSSMAPQLQTH